MEFSEVIQLLVVIGTIGTAIAALVAASIGSRNARLAENAALLASIPLLVPWRDSSTTSLRVMNRGKTDAHELEWWLIADGEEKAHDAVPRVIPAGKPDVLLSDQNAIVASLRVAKEFVIRCRYMTSWGEYLIVERTYVDNESSGITVTDDEGKRLVLRD